MCGPPRATSLCSGWPLASGHTERTSGRTTSTDAARTHCENMSIHSKTIDIVNSSGQDRCAILVENGLYRLAKNLQTEIYRRVLAIDSYSLKILHRSCSRRTRLKGARSDVHRKSSTNSITGPSVHGQDTSKSRENHMGERR